MSDQQASDTIRQMLQDWNAATPEQRAEASAFAKRSAAAVTKLTKVAVIRPPISGPLILNCPCGARPITDGKNPTIVNCICGRRYTGAGWLLDSPNDNR